MADFRRRAVAGLHREILDLLHEYQASYVFVLGEKVEQHPEIIKAMIRGGHEVGNHTFDHVRLTKASQREREQELERTALDLELLGCPRAGQLGRPPYSDFDKRLVSFLKNNPPGNSPCGASIRGTGRGWTPPPSCTTSLTGSRTARS